MRKSGAIHQPKTPCSRSTARCEPETIGVAPDMHQQPSDQRGHGVHRSYSGQKGQRARWSQTVSTFPMFTMLSAEHFRDELEADRRRALRTHSGLLYIVRQVGKGNPPEPRDTVLTECVGYLEDGTKFWSSYDTGKPFQVPLGAGKLIRGWEEAYLTMHPGEKRRLIIPAALAYGHQGNKQAGIPPDATLVLDVELLSVVHH